MSNENYGERNWREWVEEQANYETVNTGDLIVFSDYNWSGFVRTVGDEFQNVLEAGAPHQAVVDFWQNVRKGGYGPQETKETD